MQAERRAPQVVTHLETPVRAILPQFVMQTLSSPLHFIGCASAGCEPASTAVIANAVAMPMSTFMAARYAESAAMGQAEPNHAAVRQSSRSEQISSKTSDR